MTPSRHGALDVSGAFGQHRTLVRPMISGDKHTAGTVPPRRDVAATRLLALVVFMLCAGFAWWIALLRV